MIELSLFGIALIVLATMFATIILLGVGVMFYKFMIDFDRR